MNGMSRRCSSSSRSKEWKLGAEQHRDFAQLDALLAQFQDALGDKARLHMLVLRADQQRAQLALALGGQYLGVFLGWRAR